MYNYFSPRSESQCAAELNYDLKSLDYIRMMNETTTYGETNSTRNVVVNGELFFGLLLNL